ncbi:hypothetical protein CICLE_v10003127mg, partial [Citrus x clementina]
IGTANPANCVYQTDYPDFYFRITSSNHMTELKEKFKRMYILVPKVPKLGKEAVSKAIKEWGQPISKITHLISCSVSGVDMPGADYQLTKLLGLKPSVKRVMLTAESNAGARVLVVCSEITVGTFRAPSDENLSCLVNRAIVGDGTAALIVGACPDINTERPLFHIVPTAQTILPDSEDAIKGHFRESPLIADNIDKFLAEAFDQVSLNDHDWNSLFWMMHPIGPAVLDQIEGKLGLEKTKLRETRHVLSEYGNMASATVLFVLDEMRKRSVEEGKATTGEELEWGVLLGFEAGLTVEAIVLRSIPMVSN